MAGGWREIVSRRIIFEGIDGCGKDTLAILLANLLLARGVNCHLSPEPDRSTKVGGLIDKCLRKEIVLEGDVLQLLFMANRREVVTREAVGLKQGVWQIKPRSFMSTAAYWGDKTVAEVVGMHRLAMPEVEQFDLAFWLDLSPDEALKRLARSGRKQELFEQEEKMWKARERYQQVMEMYPEKSVRLDAENFYPDGLVDLVMQELVVRGWV